MFRSLQHCSDSRGLDFASIVRMSREGKVEITSADGSNTAHSMVSGAFFPGSTAFGESPNASPPMQTHSTSVLHENGTSEGIPAASLPHSSEENQIEVRNTFIHFEGQACADERAVRSMPHGMFKQCILSEASQGGHFTPTTTSGSGSHTPTVTSEQEQELESVPGTIEESQEENCLQLSIGSLAIIEGLVKVPEFNGCSAVVQGWDEGTQRYDVLLAAPGGCQHAKIKEENLRVVLPCP